MPTCFAGAVSGEVRAGALSRGDVRGSLGRWPVFWVFIALIVIANIARWADPGWRRQQASEFEDLVGGGLMAILLFVAIGGLFYLLGELRGCG